MLKHFEVQGALEFLESLENPLIILIPDNAIEVCIVAVAYIFKWHSVFLLNNLSKWKTFHLYTKFNFFEFEIRQF